MTKRGRPKPKPRPTRSQPAPIFGRRPPAPGQQDGKTTVKMPPRRKQHNMRIYYKDFATRKRKWTAGKFIHWDRGGILNAWGAIVERRASILFIPRYLIERESLAKLPPLPGEAAPS